MRIISFTMMWDKLKELRFTTFRFPRKDKDWQVGEPIFVGYEIHMVVGGTLQSLKGWAEGFDIDDYEH